MTSGGSWVPAVRLNITITILCGTRAGQRFVVTRGETLRFGRTAKADVIVTDDPTMSALHFEIEHFEVEHGETAVVARDLQSRNRLFLNGKAVTEAVLADGDQLRAGRTYFSVSVSGRLPPSGLPHTDDETRASGPLDATQATFRATGLSPLLADLLPAAALFPGQLAGKSATNEETLDGPSGTLSEIGGAANRFYAIVDGQIATELLAEAQRANRRFASLEPDRSSSSSIGSAPYLIEVPREVTLAAHRRLAQGDAPGVLIESPAEFERVVHHLREIVRRGDAPGGRATVRLSEPNLLYRWLKECDRMELAEFFGCLSSILLDTDSRGKYRRLTRVGEQLVEEHAALYTARGHE